VTTQPDRSSALADSQPVRWSFDRAAMPVPRSFYERELGELRRPSRGWASPKAGCPFHASKSKTSFRLHLESGAFRCFGCGVKGGDVLSFARLRYHLDFRQAAGYVGALREVTPAGRKQIDRAKREREQAEAAVAAEKEDERHERIEAREHLHAVETLPRTCVFAASVNDETPLTDETGNRRFWPVRCGSINIPALIRDRDQLWAEAYKCYRDGVVWWLDSDELNKLAKAEQEERYDLDIWHETIMAWANDPKQRFEKDGASQLPIEPFFSVAGCVTVTDVLVHAIGRELERCTQTDKEPRRPLFDP
jgi:hypothetical protein